jgi:hypothetical protein
VLTVEVGVQMCDLPTGCHVHTWPMIVIVKVPCKHGEFLITWSGVDSLYMCMHLVLRQAIIPLGGE